MASQYVSCSPVRVYPLCAHLAYIVISRTRFGYTHRSTMKHPLHANTFTTVPRRRSSVAKDGRQKAIAHSETILFLQLSHKLPSFCLPTDPPTMAQTGREAGVALYNATDVG